MGYCSPSDVAQVNKARILGAGNNPTASDVTLYINLVAGDIDAVLTTKGYRVPVNTASWPEAGLVLQSVNIKGAVWMAEEAVPTNPDARDRAKTAYDAAIKMLSDTKFSLDVPTNLARAEARGPWATFTPTGNTYDPLSGELHYNDQCNSPADPFFSRQLEF